MKFNTPHELEVEFCHTRAFVSGGLPQRSLPRQRAGRLPYSKALAPGVLSDFWSFRSNGCRERIGYSKLPHLQASDRKIVD